MKLSENKWAFTEILGHVEDVKNAVEALKEAGVLYGRMSSIEEKNDKRFVQFYICNENVQPLSSEEEQIYNAVSLQHYVHIAYTFMGHACQDFPMNGENDFPIKYWEWWTVD